MTTREKPIGGRTIIGLAASAEIGERIQAGGMVLQVAGPLSPAEVKAHRDYIRRTGRGAEGVSTGGQLSQMSEAGTLADDASAFVTHWYSAIILACPVCGSQALELRKGKPRCLQCVVTVN